MFPVLEAVPNFSEGRDPDFLSEVVRVAARPGVEVVDASRDEDHNRSVVTLLGAPDEVVAATVAMADVAVQRIDLRRHSGTHPRVGALDVLPFVPLVGCTMSDAVAAARRAGHLLSERGLPVYFYGHASSPPGRSLADIRRGGFEGMARGFSVDEAPDLSAGRTGPHPGAGVACVGARPLLLAWNLWVEGVSLEELKGVARAIREARSGLRGVRALAMSLPRQGGLQLSMNLEDVAGARPMAVFERAEELIGEAGGRILRTEVIGMVPQTLVLEASASRLSLSGVSAGRFLPARIAEHLARRGGRDVATVASWVLGQGASVPGSVREAAARLHVNAISEPSPGDPA